MGLEITPKDSLDGMEHGEEDAFTLTVTAPLGTNTIDSISYAIYDSAGADVTDDFGGGYSESAGVITFGVIAHAAGNYDIEFIITCNEFLPDGTTPKEFYANLSVIVS